MSGRHEAPRKKQSGKNIFADCIIALCIGVSLVVTLAVLWEYHRLSTVIPAGVLGSLLGLWGGELLIIALRQIFGRDVMSQLREKQMDSEDDSI